MPEIPDLEAVPGVISEAQYQAERYLSPFMAGVPIPRPWRVVVIDGPAMEAHYIATSIQSERPTLTT